jgi:hypothetical protein
LRVAELLHYGAACGDHWQLSLVTSERYVSTDPHSPPTFGPITGTEDVPAYLEVLSSPSSINESGRKIEAATAIMV